jgi:hypothetical protein
MKVLAVAVASYFTVLFLSVSTLTAQNENPFGGASSGGADSAVRAIRTIDAVKVRESRAREKNEVANEAPATDDQIRTALRTRIDLIFDEAPFDDVRIQLQNDLKINILIHPATMEFLDGDTLTSSNLTGVEAGKGLRMVLNSLDATWVVKDGVLLIIPKNREFEPEFLVRRLIDVQEHLNEHAVGDLAKTADASTTGAHGAAAESKLQLVLHETVTPEAWSSRG